MLLNITLRLSALYKLSPVIVVLIFFTSCFQEGEKYFDQIGESRNTEQDISISYPINNSIFPPEICAPSFIWDNPESKYKNWFIFISDTNGKTIYSEKSPQNTWKPDSSFWQNLKEKSPETKLQFSVVGIKKGILKKKIGTAKIEFSISADSVGSPIFFRAVPLPFSYAVQNVSEIEWYLGKVGTPPKKVLDNIPVCANCHSFPKDGSTLAMDVDYANDKGSYTLSEINDTTVIEKNDIITWSDYRRDDGENTFGLLSQISPDGRYVVSTVKDRSVFVAIDDDFEYSQLFFPVKGILAYYDKVKDSYSELNGASDKDFVQSNPSWSPDGKEIIFTRSPRYTSEKLDNSSDVLLTASDAEEFISGGKDFKFDLYRLQFNDGKGSEAIPVEGASNNGKSNYFARYSPDHKWIVFCQANSYMLLQKDSKLFIMPATGGKPRLMNCNLDNMNSWHSWSPNSKWLVFSSKKQGAYTQLYLTHIDENGIDSPPILLENFRFDEKAANIPEFYSGTGIHSSFDKIIDDFSLSPLYFVRNAEDNNRYKEYVKAFENLEKAIELDSSYYDAYILRIQLNSMLNQTGQYRYKNDAEIALKIINKKINKDPENANLLLDRARLFLLENQYDKTIADAEAILKTNKKNHKAYELACAGYRAQNNWEKAIEYYKKLLALNPDNDKEIRSYLIAAYKSYGKRDEALREMNNLIDKYPSNGVLYMNRAFFMAEAKNISACYSDMDKATVLAADDYKIYQKRNSLYTYLGKKKEAENQLPKALALLEKNINEKPEDINLLFDRADIYQKMKDINSALADYYTVLNFFPENYKALSNIAQINLNLKNLNEALKSYETLMSSYDVRVEFYINSAIINIQLNNHSRALSLFNKGLKIEPDNAELLYNRAIFYLSLKEQVKAKNDLERLSKLLTTKTKNGSITKKEEVILKKAEQDLKNML